jgi:hypothetical protein
MRLTLSSEELKTMTKRVAKLCGTMSPNMYSREVRERLFGKRRIKEWYENKRRTK